MADVGDVQNRLRLSLNLTVRAAAELEALQNGTGLSRTDLVCRAIGLYKWVTDRLDEDARLLIRDANGEAMEVHIQ